MGLNIGLQGLFLQAVGFAGLAFDAVTVVRSFEETFGHRDSKTECGGFCILSYRKDNTVGVRKKRFSLLEKRFNRLFAFNPFVFR